MYVRFLRCKVSHYFPNRKTKPQYFVNNATFFLQKLLNEA
jgi:hypothetical protein